MFSLNIKSNKRKLSSKKALYKKIEQLSDSIGKRRIIFYRHIKRIKGNRFQLFMNKKMKTKWFKNTLEDIKELQF